MADTSPFPHLRVFVLNAVILTAVVLFAPTYEFVWAWYDGAKFEQFAFLAGGWMPESALGTFLFWLAVRVIHGLALACLLVGATCRVIGSLKPSVGNRYLILFGSLVGLLSAPYWV